MLATLIVNGADDTDARDSELTLREAIEVVNKTVAIGSLSAGEQAQITGALAAPPIRSISRSPGRASIRSPLPAHFPPSRCRS